MLPFSNYVVWLIFPLIIYETSALSYNQPKLCPSATWNKNGTTLVDNSNIGGMVRGIFVDYNDTVFVVAYQKSQIVIWSKETIRTLSVNLYEYTALFVTINSDIYFENGNETGRIDKWIMNPNSSTFVTKFSGHCCGLFVDINSTLYCSVKDAHQVVKTSLDEKNATPITVAGTGSRGNASNELSWSWGIFVDINFNLYVADAGNNRIQLFCPGQWNATTVAGREIPQNLTLNFPTDVVLDADDYLYIADNDKDRVIRSGHGEWQCVVGCSGNRGLAPNELTKSYSIRFDSRGNLYVADEFNSRVQKFTLATNSCGTSATTMATINYIASCSSIVSTAESPQQSTFSPAPSTCSTELGIGPNCNISNALCDMLEPCQNNCTCTNTNATVLGYICSCWPGFNGTRCEFDNRPCKPNTCWNNGTCDEKSNTTFNCQCASGWVGTHCERIINYCQNVTCQNRGVCRPLFRNYKCECLGNNYYSGRHCEIKTKRIIIFNIISKSCSYIAIIVMVTTAMFIIIMDILKYCFGIDPVHEERERIRREKWAKKRKPVIQRFVYVNAPPPPPSENPVPTIEETTV